MVKNLPAISGDISIFPGQEDFLEKGMATYSSILAWRSPWIEKPGGLYFTGSHRVRYDLATKQQQHLGSRILLPGHLWWREEVAGGVLGEPVRRPPSITTGE